MVADLPDAVTTAWRAGSNGILNGLLRDVAEAPVRSCTLEHGAEDLDSLPLPRSSPGFKGTAAGSSCRASSVPAAPWYLADDGVDLISLPREFSQLSSNGIVLGVT